LPAADGCGGIRKLSRENGFYRTEGKEYVVKDGDVLLFKFNM
jgi:hypothetical protein